MENDMRLTDALEEVRVTLGTTFEVFEAMSPGEEEQELITALGELLMATGLQLHAVDVVSPYLHHTVTSACGGVWALFAACPRTLDLRQLAWLSITKSREPMIPATPRS